MGTIVPGTILPISAILAGMDLKEDMAANLRRLRQRLEHTQEEVAERAGLSVRYVGAIERADVAASVTVLGRIADALGVEPSELVKHLRRVAICLCPRRHFYYS